MFLKNTKKKKKLPKVLSLRHNTISRWDDLSLGNHSKPVQGCTQCDLMRPHVTESKFILFATRQANTSRDQGMGQGIVTLFTIFLKLEFRLFFYRKREESLAGCFKVLGAGILCSCGWLHRSGHNVPVNLQQDKWYSRFCNI